MPGASVIGGAAVYARCNSIPWHTVPVARMAAQLEAYVLRGQPPCSFLRALVMNDWRNAMFCADEENMAEMLDWARFFHNEMPALTWGNRGRVERWIAHNGASGIDCAQLVAQ